MKSHLKLKGLKIGLDFFSSVLTGALIGFGFDYLFQTKPFLFCFFIVLGFASGLNNILKEIREKSSDRSSSSVRDKKNL